MDLCNRTWLQKGIERWAWRISDAVYLHTEKITMEWGAAVQKDLVESFFVASLLFKLLKAVEMW